MWIILNNVPIDIRRCSEIYNIDCGTFELISIVIIKWIIVIVSYQFVVG